MYFKENRLQKGKIWPLLDFREDEKCSVGGEISTNLTSGVLGKVSDQQEYDDEEAEEEQ